MTQEQINAGNKLIAEFMGLKMIEAKDITENTNINEYCYEPRYHSSWDWVIPVVNKILKVYAENEFIRNELNKEENMVIKFSAKNMLGTFENEYRINSTFLKVTDFIKWYNQNSKK